MLNPNSRARAIQSFTERPKLGKNIPTIRIDPITGLGLFPMMANLTTYDIESERMSVVALERAVYSLI